jgi:hypothetical protein
MIKKSILVACLLGIGHLLAVVVVKPWWDTTQNQRQANTIDAQAFLYAAQTPEKLIVGSSLTTRLVQDSLRDIHKLAFAGQGVLDCLELILRREQLPKLVLVEMNIMRLQKVSFVKGLTNPIPFYLKKNVPSLLERHQPVGLVGNLLAFKVVTPVLHQGKVLLAGEKQGDEAVQANKRKIFEDMLVLRTAEYQELPEEARSQQFFQLLSEQVGQLEARGCRVAFVELPIDPSLTHLPKSVYLREAFQQRFPPNRYAYILSPHPHDYETSDGTHLQLESSRRYSAYLAAMAKPLLP